MDVGIEFEAGLDFGDDFSGTLESVVYIVARLEMLGFVGEFAASELGDLVELRAFGFEVFGDGADEFVNSSFEGLGVKNDQSLVFAAHGMEVGVDW